MVVPAQWFAYHWADFSTISISNSVKLIHFTYIYKTVGNKYWGLIQFKQ